MTVSLVGGFDIAVFYQGSHGSLVTTLWFALELPNPTPRSPTVHPEFMKHKASLWDGEAGSSTHITDVHWEGDITQEELMEVADQISADWQTIDLELDPAHPCHGRTYRLQRTWPRPGDEEDSLRILEAEDELEGKFVWVHCCQNILDPLGELVDNTGRNYRQVFNTAMFCCEFTSFDDIAVQCDDTFGADAWDAYELYPDDALPEPVAYYG